MEMNRLTRLNLQLQSGSTGLILAAILLLAAYASHRYHQRWDWTEGSRHTLAEQSVKAIRVFSHGLVATAYVQEGGDSRVQIEALLNKYQAVLPTMVVRFVDPDLDPLSARKAGVAVYGTVVFRVDDKSEKVSEANEETLTNALIRLAKGDTKVVRFISGHGEHAIDGQDQTAYGNVVLSLKGEGYGVETVHLAGVESVPDKTTVLVLAGPRKPLLPIELERLNAWMVKAGRLLVMIDPNTKHGTDDFLGKFGVTLLDGVVMDPVARLFGTKLTTPIINQYEKDHPITADLQAATFFPEARGLRLAPVADSSGEIRSQLLLGAERGWLRVGDATSDQAEFNPGSDKKGPILMGAAVERQATRLVVVGDADFAADAYADFSGNADLFLNMIRWLAEDESYMAIKAKVVTDAGITLTQRQGVILFWGLTAGVPLCLLVTGMVIWRRRQRR